MKIKILLTILGAAAFAAITTNVSAADALLSPRAAGNEIKRVSGMANDQNLLAANSDTLLSPRALGNQTMPVAGTTPLTMKCPAMGSPKDVAMAGKAAHMGCCNLTLAGCPTMDKMPTSN